MPMRSMTPISVALSASVLVALSGCEGAPARDRYAVVGGEVVEVPGIAMGDARTIDAIIEEGRDNSQVMDILRAYTVEMGPRLTGSSRLERAQRWTRDRFAEWGLSNARLEQWGTIATRFDRGESFGNVLLVGEGDDGEPETLRELELTTLSWSRGTDGAVRGRPIRLPSTPAEYEANRGQYGGAWVMIAPDYTGRVGVRSNGFMMRERMDERHEIRNGTPDAPSMDKDSMDEPMGKGEDGPGGDVWVGTFDYNGSKIPLTLVIDDSAEGISGTMSIEGFSEGPISDGALEDGMLTFTWTHSMGTSEIELSIEGNAASGKSVAASGNEYALELAREIEGEISDEERAEMDRVEALRLVLGENPAGFVSSSRDDRVWTTSASGWRERELADYPVDVEVQIRQSDFDFIIARADEGLDLELEFDMNNGLTAGPIPVYNTIAEIRGSEFPDEVVIISAHIDSWDGPGSMGTTDNGTGSAVMTEAARILAAVGVKPKRTIRVIHWTGEEQGLLGARAYVDTLSEDERARISAAFVDDGGTNYQGGIPAADFMVEYLAAASAPTNGVFRSGVDMRAQLQDEDSENDALAGHMNVNIRPTGATINTHGGSDHAAFNSVGIPGFFWDEVGRGDYGVSWHTQNDTYDMAIEEYLVQSATNMAIVAYNLANAPGLLPREGDVDEAAGEDDSAR